MTSPKHLLTVWPLVLRPIRSARRAAKVRATTDPFALAKTIDQKLERIYQLANHRVSPSLEAPQPSLKPLTRAERQAVMEISQVLGINVHGQPPKTKQRRVTF